MIFDRTSLHGDQPRPAQQELPERIRAVELGSIESAVPAAVESEARAHGLSARAFLVAAVGVVLWRYGGRAPHVLGCQQAANTVVSCVRFEPTSSDTFLEVWRATDNALDGDANGELIPQALISWDGLPANTHSADLMFRVHSRGNAPSVHISWDLALFEAAFIEQLARSIAVLTRAAVEHPNQRCATLPILDAVDHHRIVHTWNAHAAPASASTLCHLFEAQARARVNHSAVVHNDQALSYRELDALSTHMAAKLRDEGVERNVPVAIYLQRSIAMVASVLAVLKAGGCIVPLDPSYPAERISYILTDCHAKLVIAAESPMRGLSTGIESNQHRVLQYEQLTHSSTGSRDDRCNVSPDDLAYIIYTSGSTGTPKGVMVQHRSIANFLVGHNRFANVHAQERHAQVASFSFDVALFEMCSPLVAGATSVIAPDLAHVSMLDFSRFLEQQHITSVFMPPAYWQSWMLSLQSSSKKVPESITRFYIGADKIESHMISLWNQVSHSKAQLINGYGPTEATVCTAAYKFVPGQTFEPHERVPIGRPTACSTTYIVDEDLNVVPAGVAGELLIGGDTLAAGYYQRPSLTAERFLPDYYSGRPAQRVYRSGDLARYRSDGTLDFLGRIDDQVKIRGFRIELGEVEHCAQQHPDVEQAVAIVDQRGAGTKELALFVVRRAASSALRQGALRKYLRDKLPAHMVPGRIAFIERMPSTPNGKLARDQLLALSPQRSSEADYVAPRDALEERLVAIWAKILVMDAGELGVLDEFADLGVTSLMFMTVAEEIARSFGETLAKDLLERPAPAHIAALSEQICKLGGPSLGAGALAARTGHNHAGQHGA